jgi:hypothetical protein
LGRDISTGEGYFHRRLPVFPYTYNQNHPRPRINQLRVFDFNDRDPQLDVAHLVVQRAIAEPKQFGFGYDRIAGSGVPEVTCLLRIISRFAYWGGAPRGYSSILLQLHRACRQSLNPRFRRADGKFVVRGDLRLDVSDRDVFLEGHLVRKRQFTSAVNLIYWF